MRKFNKFLEGNVPFDSLSFWLLHPIRSQVAGDIHGSVGVSFGNRQHPIYGTEKNDVLSIAAINNRTSWFWWTRQERTFNILTILTFFFQHAQLVQLGISIFASTSWHTGGRTWLGNARDDFFACLAAVRLTLGDGLVSRALLLIKNWRHTQRTWRILEGLKAFPN